MPDDAALSIKPRRRWSLSWLGDNLKHLPSTLLTLVFMSLFLISVVLPMAAVVSSKVFASFAAVASFLIDLPSIRDQDRLRHQAETKRLSTSLEAERARVKTLDQQNRLREAQITSSNRQITNLKADKALKAEEIRAFQASLKAKEREIGKLTSEKTLAAKRANVALIDPDRLIRYRGETVTLRQAVSQTSTRVRTVAAQMSARNLASMPGESVPFWGVAVVVAATTWELTDTCTMMTDLYTLEIALIGIDAVKPDAVCGLPVPTVQQLRNRIAESPDAIVAAAKGIYGGLPEFQWQAGWDILVRDSKRLFFSSQ